MRPQPESQQEMGLSQIAAPSAKLASLKRRWGQRGQRRTWQEDSDWESFQRCRVW